ncbi:hypothetical protein T3A99_18445, partial [Pseudomonas sp. N-137]|uniref:hypothetical protein n=1 Tax=Pseudomonas sp. N-137 TaxID=3108452 RepID=UPI002ADEF859
IDYSLAELDARVHPVSRRALYVAYRESPSHTSRFKSLVNPEKDITSLYFLLFQPRKIHYKKRGLSPFSFFLVALGKNSIAVAFAPLELTR